MSDLDKEIFGNHQRCMNRKNLYKALGYNIDEEQDYIINKAQPIFGDILEVGTGKGYFAISLAKEGYRFTSLDISEEEQKIAKLNLQYYNLDNFVDFKIENAEHLSFEDKSFDIIFLINVLHHLENPFRVIDELMRIVTFEGKIILSDFTEKGLGIIDTLQAQEGRIHPSGTINMLSAEEYILQKKFKTKMFKTDIHEVLVAYQPTI